MKNSKILSITLAATLALSPMATVGAEKIGKTEIASMEEIDKADFFKKELEVRDINKKDNGKYSLTLSGKEENQVGDLIIHLDDSVLIVDSKNRDPIDLTSIEEGDQLEVYIRSNTPVTSSMPPQVSPQVLVLKNDDTNTNVDLFDANLVNKANSLKLNIDKDSVLVDRDGGKVDSSDLEGRELLVFYGPSTKSIPAQTSPEKVIVLDLEEDFEEDLKDLSKIRIDGRDIDLEDEIINKDDIYMLPLRELVEELGYEVLWKGEDRGIELTKGSLWHQLHIGKNKYNFAKMSIELETAPILEGGKTYVPASFVEEVLRTYTSNIEDGILNIVED